MADVITRLKVESSEYDSKIKRASQGLLQMEQDCRKVGGTLAILEKEDKDFVASLGQMETVSKDARGQLNELTKAFTDLSLQYKRLTDEEKQGDFGTALKSSLDQLKTRINDTKIDLEEINKELSGGSGKFGEFGNIIDTIGHKLGLTANATELLTSKTALMYSGIGAGIAIIGKATDAWASYNAELAKQDQITTVTTGLKGSAADNMTDSLRALSQTYNVDFRESVNAANTLMTQFGKTGDEAIQLLKDGMQGMIMGDGPKMLSMIQQYAPAFRDAGISADKLVAIIHNTEGGIFTDENMNAIVMGIKNIRLMTQSTSDALAKLGIDGQKMAKSMSEGSLTVFDALRMVSNAIENTKAGSKEAGEVMQTVFGRQGTMAGTKLGEAIATLNTNLEETKKQTGDVGDAYADLQRANEKLNVAIRDCFGYDGWEEMTIGIKTGLIEALSEVINVLAEIKNTVGSVIGAVGDAVTSLTGAKTAVNKIEQRRVEILENSGASPEYYSDTQKNISQRIASLKKSGDKQAAYDSDIAAIEALIEEKRQEVEEAEKQKKANDREKLKNSGSAIKGILAYGVSKKLPSADVLTKQDELNVLREAKASYIEQANSILYKKSGTPTPTPTTRIGSELTPQQTIQKQITELTNEALTADEDRLEVIKKEISALNEQLKVYKEIQDYVTGKGAVAHGSLPQLTQQLKDLQQAQSQSLDTREWVEYQRQIDETSTKIDILKGKWKEGLVATFSIDVNNTEAYDLLKNLEGVSIDDESITVTADTAEAYNKVQELIGSIEGTSVSFEVKPEMKTLPTLDDYRIQAMIEMDVQKVKADTETLHSIIKDSLQQGIDTAGLNLEPLSEQIANGINVPDETWQAILDQYNELREQIGMEPIKLNFDTGKKVSEDGKHVKEDWKDAAKAVQSVGTALQQIEDPGAKVAGIIGQAIANIALGFAQATAKDSKFGVFGWIAAIAGGLGTMISTISAVKSATSGSYAEGGIVPGNSYSGDRLMANVNSGELILNKAQQNTLAAELTSRDNGGGFASMPYVTGEKIVLGINNWAKSQGKGQLVFSRG